MNTVHPAYLRYCWPHNMYYYFSFIIKDGEPWLQLADVSEPYSPAALTYVTLY